MGERKVAVICKDEGDEAFSVERRYRETTWQKDW